MDRKTLIQLIIILIIIIISISIYLGYFNESPKNLKINSNAEKIGTNTDKTTNYIENINYTSNISGNRYKITAESAKIKVDTPDIMFLENVIAYITIKNTDTIKITSSFGKYNSQNYDTVFSKDVVATYPDHKIIGEYLDFSFINNIGTFSTNIIYTNDKAKMFADKIEIDLTSNDTKIFMFDDLKKILIKGTK
tara:strand:+ start:363 stop:944 length:582 start_codon:yes stop_codon:yes gene_type:complete